MAKKNTPPNHTGKTYKTNKTNDARVLAFKRAYLDSNNPATFCNITKSAQAAGYSWEYGNNLSARTNQPKWWLEFKRQGDFLRASMLKQAEKNLNNTLEEQPENDAQRKIKTDVSKFVSERLGKEHYSTRQELTDADGRKLFTNNTKDGADIALDELFVGVSADRTSDKAE